MTLNNLELKAANMKTYTTQLGQEIEIQPVPPMLVAKVQQATNRKAEELYPATRPTYEVVDAGGGVLTFEHDKDSVATDEERAALAEYEAQMQKRTTFINEQMLKFFLMRGLKVELPQDNAWAEAQALFGVEVPEGGIERLLHYIQTEIIASADDLQGLTEAIMRASGVSNEALNAARASFRGELREETDPTRRVDNAVQPAERPALVDLGPLYATGSGAGVGANVALPMG